jgi:hypothetical protein
MIQQKLNKLILTCCLILGSTVSLYAQVTPPPSPADTSVKVIQWINSDLTRNQKVNDSVEYFIMVGNVILQHETTIFKCDSAVLNQKTRILEAFGNIHINESDSINIYSQYLKYYGSTRLAELRKKVKLTDGKIELLTENFNYNLAENVGDYFKGGKVINQQSVLTSVEGTYYGDLKDVFFKKEVKLVDPQYKLNTDSLLYNTETEIATFVTRTTIIDSTQKQIVTNDGYYDVKNRKAKFGKNPVITDPVKRTMATADDIITDDSTGLSKLWGNAIFADSAQGQVLGGNYIEVNSKNNNLFAEKDPYLIIKQENDSLYLRADQFKSGKVTDLIIQLRTAAYTDTSLGLDSAGVEAMYPLPVLEPGKDSADRYFIGYRNVKVYSDSLQAVADSIYYSNVDSVLRLYIDPVAWNPENQMSGDTMYVFTKNQQPDEIMVFENAFAINKYGNELYNQLKGRRINAFFLEGNINLIRSRGSAESIYYIPDNDSALIGVNKLEGSIIELRFINKELNQVAAIDAPNGKMVPIQQAGDSDKQLPDFKWREADRPKSKYDILPKVRFIVPEAEKKKEEVAKEVTVDL